MSWYKIKKLAPHLFQVIEGNFVSFFILQGKKETILVDCGYGITNTYEEFKEYFVGDLKVLNTHIHPDHSNGNGYFTSTYMHFIEWETHAKKWNANTYKIKEGKWSPSGLFKPLRLDNYLPDNFDSKSYDDWVSKGIPTPSFFEEGELIDIGNFQLEVILTPAHTQGSVSFLDHNRGLLFVGDTFCKDLKWLLNLKCRASLNGIFNTYQKLSNRHSEIEYILPSHGEVMFDSKLLLEINQKMQLIKEHSLEPTYHTTKYIDPGYYFDFGGYGPVMPIEVVDDH